MDLKVSFLHRFWLTAKNALIHNRNGELWPSPKVESIEEPIFFFIVTPPYSGSTALAQVLNSCSGTCFLHKKAEGQWLVPGMCQMPERWGPKTYMDWDSIRAVWLNRVQLIRNLVQDVEVVIEKSPPNLVRFDKLTTVFPRHIAIAYNRDPFANCASTLFRRHNPQAKSQNERLQILKNLTSDWICHSVWIKKWIDEMKLLYISYEQFCKYPNDLVDHVSATHPVFESIDINKKIKVKDYTPAKLINHNLRQISKLTDEEIETISELLLAEQDLVEFFGYNPLGPCELE